MAEPGHWGSGMSNDGWGSFAVIMSHPGNRLLSGGKQSSNVCFGQPPDEPDHHARGLERRRHE